MAVYYNYVTCFHLMLIILEVLCYCSISEIELLSIDINMTMIWCLVLILIPNIGL